MIDREKVIKGVESCIKMGRLDVENCRELNCPYFENGLRLSCWIDVLNDALAMLKEQPEIVRCRDCGNAYLLSDRVICSNPRNAECEEYPFNHFCADGERKR